MPNSLVPVLSPIHVLSDRVFSLGFIVNDISIERVDENAYVALLDRMVERLFFAEKSVFTETFGAAQRWSLRRRSGARLQGQEGLTSL